ncbi:hypothetical protein [Cellulosilyticum ruminicola]|uniref:hypothetical protein n=1 Tax=Cellulosilyticum ruminicola TaxID=425254 RepID=UPI0006D014D6|nr:hypothetical protein [Cellulosilyticum ruminicola]
MQKQEKMIEAKVIKPVNTALKEQTDINTKDYTAAYKTQRNSTKKQNLRPAAYTNLELVQNKASIRQEARTYIKAAKSSYDDFKNRGQGDSCVRSILYASWQLGIVCKRILRQEVTPKVIYDFQYAKHLFEVAKKMKMIDTLELPLEYSTKLEALHKREEEEDYDWYTWDDEEDENAQEGE